MLRAAQPGLSAPWLARTMLFLAVGATLACNVAFGFPHGWPGALLAGWPAVAFIGCAEVAISMSRKRSPRGHDRAPATDTGPAATRTRKRTATRSPKRTPATDTAAAVPAALAADPAMTTGQLAARTGVSDRTVRRVRARLNGATT